MAFAPGQKTFEWMGIECPLFDRVYERVAIPEWAERRKVESREYKETRRAWEDEELRRCEEGWGPFCGSYYFYYNYCWIMGDSETVDANGDKKRGRGNRMRPELRMTDNLDFMLEEKVERECTGYVKPKRRRQGATWRCAAQRVRNGVLFEYTSSGYSSSDEKKTKEFIQRCGYIFDNLPAFLKADLLNRNLLQLYWATEKKDEFKNTVISGNQSVLEGRAPGNIVWEAYKKNCVIQDEAGKLSSDVDLQQWITNTAPILAGNDGLTRSGYMGIFGTVGEMDNGPGTIFRNVYNAAADYDLMQFFIPGTWGMRMDEFGNDDFDAALDFIESERKKKKRKKDQIDWRQQYPLTIEDCFVQNEDKFFYDLGTLEKIDENIMAVNPNIGRGSFMQDSAGRVIFHQSEKGHVEILEDPIAGYPNMYAGGVDPVDHGSGKGTSLEFFKKNKTRGKGLSDLAFVIQKRKAQLGGKCDYPVCIYSNREADVEDAYMQCILAAIYYKCLLNCEQNRKGFIIWAKTAGYAKYLARGAKNLGKVAPGSTYEYGYNKDNTTSDMLADFVVKWLAKHWDKLFFGRLNNSLKAFGNKNADLAEAFSGALFLCKQYDDMEAKATRNQERLPTATKILPVLKIINGKRQWTQ